LDPHTQQIEVNVSQTTDYRNIQRNASAQFNSAVAEEEPERGKPIQRGPLSQGNLTTTAHKIGTKRLLTLVFSLKERPIVLRRDHYEISDPRTYPDVRKLELCWKRDSMMFTPFYAGIPFHFSDLLIAIFLLYLVANILVLKIYLSTDPPRTEAFRNADSQETGNAPMALLSVVMGAFEEVE